MSVVSPYEVTGFLPQEAPSIPENPSLVSPQGRDRRPQKDLWKSPKHKFLLVVKQGSAVVSTRPSGGGRGILILVIVAVAVAVAVAVVVVVVVACCCVLVHCVWRVVLLRGTWGVLPCDAAALCCWGADRAGELR